VTGSVRRSNNSDPTTRIAAGDFTTSRLCDWKFWKKPDAHLRICFVWTLNVSGSYVYAIALWQKDAL
jgi:hypothetical protein